MGKGLKLLLAGALFGLLAVFAAIGVKSMLADRQMVTQDNGFVATQPEGSTIIADPAASSTQDVPPAGTDVQIPVNVQLEGESADPASPTADAAQVGTVSTPAQQTQAPVSQQDLNGPDLVGEEDDIELVAEVGQMNLTVTDPGAGQGAGIDAEFLVLDDKGLQVASMSGGNTASFELEPGNYLVRINANGKTTTRTLGVFANKITNARFELPAAPAPAQTATQAPEPAKGQLLVSVRAAEGNVALKSNIYVQKQDGTHVAKKNYDNQGDFLLEPGTYKVTVKADGRKDITRTVTVGANGVARETFAMQLPAPAAPVVQQQPVNQASQQQSAQQTQQQRPPRGEGTLAMSLNTGRGLPAKARFVVRNQQGERVANIAPSVSAEIRLPAGKYEVMAGLGRGMRQTRMVNVVAGQGVKVDFEAREIVDQFGGIPAANQNQQQANQQQNNQQQQGQQPAPQAPAQQQGGRLQLHAISGVDGKPLKVNFTVSNRQGQLIQAINNVAYAEINVPPQEVVVGINYESMNGREVIRVKPNEPTVFTFTITPNNGAAQQQQPAATPEQVIMDTIQQEIFKRMQ